LCCQAHSQGSITYEVLRIIESRTVVGTLTTDGTLGNLDPSNFQAWDVNVGGVQLNETNSVIVLIGRGIMATPEELVIDMSRGPAGGFSLCNGTACNVDGIEWQILPSGTITERDGIGQLPCSIDFSCGGIEVVDNNVAMSTRDRVDYTSAILLGFASINFFSDGFEQAP
jgi:hypothetical protein